MRSNDNHKASSAYEKVGEFVAIFRRETNWYANFQDGRRQVRRSLKTASKKEARRRALAIERDLLAGEHKHHQRPPLIEEVIEKYLVHLRSEGRAEKTVNKYQYCFDMLLEVANRQKKTRISQLDVALVDGYRSERAAGSEQRRPSKPKTVHNDTVCIRQLVNFALKRGLINDDPLNALTIKKPRRTPQPCWTRDEVDRILLAARSPHREPLVFLAETGARVGEAMWLTWGDVDFERRLIHIRPKDGWQPKSGDQRVVPMSDRLYDMLRAMRSKGRWVFTARVTKRHAERGRQISDRRLLEYLKRLLKGLGLRGHLHTLRHSFISFAAIRGVPERVLRTWIGHVDREILDWYFHLADAESLAAMQRLSQPTNKGA